MNKEKVAALVQAEIERQEKDIQKATEKLATNFNYNFEWGYAEALYKSNYIKANLTGFWGLLNEGKYNAEEWLTFHIEQIIDRLTDGTLQNSSTSHFANLAHTYKLEADQYLLKEYKSYLKRL